MSEPVDSAAPRGWRLRRMERRMITLERRLRNLDKHREWERTFDRWGPAQEVAHERDRAALVAKYDALCDRLGVSSGDNC